jgi:hypothetical protein
MTSEGLEDWRTGGLEDWRTGGLRDWGMVQLKVRVASRGLEDWRTEGLGMVQLKESE